MIIGKQPTPYELKGEALYLYFTKGQANAEYTSVVKLLNQVAGMPEEAYNILERCVSEGKKLIAVYPGIKNRDVSKLEYLGQIIDGALYMG